MVGILQLYLNLAGADALNNTFTTNHYSSEDPDGNIQDFNDKFNEKFVNHLIHSTHLAMIQSILLADAIERAGGPDSVKIKEALAETKDLELVTGLYSVDENHHPIKSATILEFVDGEQVFKTKVNP